MTSTVQKSPEGPLSCTSSFSAVSDTAILRVAITLWSLPVDHRRWYKLIQIRFLMLLKMNITVQLSVHCQNENVCQTWILTNERQESKPLFGF